MSTQLQDPPQMFYLTDLYSDLFYNYLLQVAKAVGKGSVVVGKAAGAVGSTVYEKVNSYVPIPEEERLKIQARKQAEEAKKS